MTDRSKLLALAERVAVASPEEAEREELGVQVMEALGIASYITDEGDPCLSVDGAIAIVPEDHEWIRKSSRSMTVYRIPADDKTWALHHDASGATPALALTAAALRAQAEALS